MGEEINNQTQGSIKVGENGDCSTATEISSEKQWIKNATAHALIAGDTQLEARVGVMGALRLYLDFINLFLMILRVAGGRRR